MKENFRQFYIQYFNKTGYQSYLGHAIMTAIQKEYTHAVLKINAETNYLSIAHPINVDFERYYKETRAMIKIGLRINDSNCLEFASKIATKINNSIEGFYRWRDIFTD